MAGILIITLISILALVFYLSPSKADTDKDGIYDHLDHFPNDARYYKKCCIDSSQYILLKPGEQYYPAGCECFNVNHECKCLVIDWRAYGMDEDINIEEKDKICVTIITPNVSFKYNKNEFLKDSEYSNVCFNISSNYYFGEWEIYFLNDNENPPLFIDYDIYRIL